MERVRRRGASVYGGGCERGKWKRWRANGFFVVCLVKNFQCALAKKRDAEKKKESVKKFSVAVTFDSGATLARLWRDSGGALRLWRSPKTLVEP